MKVRAWLVIVLGVLLTACGGTSKTDVQLLDAIKADGLPIGDVRTYTAETDPNNLLGRPNGYIQKSNFWDSRLVQRSTDGDISTTEGGAIEIYPDNGGAQRRMDYLQTNAKAMPLLDEYDFVHGPVLLRLSKELTPDQANEYDKAIEKALK